MKRKATLWFVLFFLFLSLSFFYGIERVYGFTLFPDEFGYWASAARAVGYDWSEVASRGSYYSFGYSLLLAPLLVLFRDALTAYRFALGINMLLLGAAFLLLQDMLKRLFDRHGTDYGIPLAALAVCYPPWLLYMNMTMAEILLVFGFVLICRLFLRYVEHPTWGRFTAVAVSAVYLYTVHMRTVPILLACIICLLLSLVLGDGKGGAGNRRGMAIRLLAALAVIVILLAVAAALKTAVQFYVYGKADKDLLFVNDYAGQMDKVRSIFGKAGLREFAVSLSGKLFYLGFASFGLFFAGMWWLGRKVVEKGADGATRLLCLFIVLSVVGEVLVCAVGAKGYSRIDELCYGRYDEHILPVLMAVGCYALLRMKYPLVYMGGVLAGGIPVVAMMESAIGTHRMTDINSGYFIAGMAYLLRLEPFEPENYFWHAYVLAAVLSCVLLVVLLLIRRRGDFVWLLAVWIGVEVFLGVSLNEDMIYSHGRERYRDGCMVEEMTRLKAEDGTGRRIVCYGDLENAVYASIIQFQMREEKIFFLMPWQQGQLRSDDFVLVCGSGEERTYLEEHYTEWDAYGAYWLYYNE